MAVSNFFKPSRKEEILRITESSLSNSFKSYVGFGDTGLKSPNTSSDESIESELRPRLLAGEALIAEAKSVLMFAPLSEMKHGKSGVLTVTNFKLSFITTEDSQKDETGHQQNFLLKEYEVCLSNIDTVYQMMGEKRRRLQPAQSVTGKVKGLYIICKNMRMLTFSFKFSPLGHGKTVANALMHHAFPRRHQLLFAYDFREPYYPGEWRVNTFREPEDWARELKRTGCENWWRVSGLNQRSQLSPSLPQWVVVPKCMVDWQLSDAALHFRGNRPPIWCWGSAHGAALVRMADIQPTITTRARRVSLPGQLPADLLAHPVAREKENVLLENVRKSHPALMQPHLMDLIRETPAPRDVRASYLRLRDLCAPESVRQFWTQDASFLHQLDNTRWLHGVSQCLSAALEAAVSLQRGASVVLQEGESRDLSCVVSSLVQLLLDPHWRTILGFQTLLQKEWVALGHPFATRLGHILAADHERSPELLLFLDCVWQLQHQFPTAFEFTETYLTTLWDSAHSSVFDTFLFDSERDRTNARMDVNNPLTLRSTWDWGEQFSDRDILLFRNPLFAPSDSTAVLRPRVAVPMLELWSQCYFRWMPLIEIPGGGRPQVDLQLRQLSAEVVSLQRAVAGEELTSLQRHFPPDVGSFFPFGQGGGQPCALLNNSLALNTFTAGEALLDSQSLLNAD